MSAELDPSFYLGLNSFDFSLEDFHSFTFDTTCSDEVVEKR